MKLKFFYNTLLTLGIVLLFMSTISAYSAGQYTILAVSIGLMLFLAYLKINLLRNIRATTKEVPELKSRAPKSQKK